MNLTKLLESRVGSHGIKFNPVLALEAKLQLEKDIEAALQIQRSEITNLLYLTKEQHLDQAIERLATTWRWWGDSLGYFNRKSDAHTFYQELKLALSHGLVWPSLQQWQNTGLFSVHGVRGESTDLYYIDPETRAAKKVSDTYTYPVIHGLAFDDSAFVTDMYVRLLSDNESANAQLIKLATVVADISLSMASYPSSEVANATDEARPLRLNVIGAASLAELQITALTISAELAAALPEFTSHQLQIAVNDKYLDFVVSKFGLHNESVELVVAENIPYVPSFNVGNQPIVSTAQAKTKRQPAVVKSEPTQVAPEMNLANEVAEPQIKVVEPVVIKADPTDNFLSSTAAEVAERIAEEIMSVEDPILDLGNPANVQAEVFAEPKLNLEETQPVIVETVPQKPEVPVAEAKVTAVPATAQPSVKASVAEITDIIHKVTIAGTEIVIASRWQDENPLEIHAVVYKSPIGFQGEINTLNKLVNLHLRAQGSIAELVETLAGESFGPAGETSNPEIPTCTSVADYIGKWLSK